jgi:RND family efflux transporter MFP subunit
MRDPALTQPRCAGPIAHQEFTMTKKKWIFAGAVLAAICLFAWYWVSRGSSEADAPSSAGSDSNAVSAAVARVKRGNIGDTLTIAGAFKPFQEVDVHAKVSGYVQTMNVDVGDHVKEGQTLAVLEVPELAAQLSGAEASVRRAQDEVRRAQSEIERTQSTYAAAHSAYTRLNQAAETRPGLVAQQELDDSQAKGLEAQAQVESAKAAFSSAQQQLEVAEANRKQYSALSSYTRIIAPFAGVITTRYADTGALVAAGTSSSTQAMPVVRLAQYSVLRLVLPIPESVAAQIHVGQTMKVHVQALNQDFEGKVSRFADALNEQTRTMETELDFENRNNRLIPGMYAQAILSIDQHQGVLTIPLEAVLRSGDGATVLVVNHQSVIEERRIELGEQGSSRAVVLGGLVEGELVIVGDRSSFHAGQKVIPKEMDERAPAVEGSR